MKSSQKQKYLKLILLHVQLNDIQAQVRVSLTFDGKLRVKVLSHLNTGAYLFMQVVFRYYDVSLLGVWEMAVDCIEIHRFRLGNP